MKVRPLAWWWLQEDILQPGSFIRVKSHCQGCMDALFCMVRHFAS